jgi:threonine/homoserine/homoserine lactone efflux protein
VSGVTLLLLVLKGVLLGLGAAAPIGPVNVEIARRVLRFGRGAGFVLGCGAVTVDVVYAVVTSIAFLPVLGYRGVMAGMSVVAAVFLTYLGALCLKSAWRGHASDEMAVAEGNAEKSARGRGGWGHYVTGLLMTALNPMTLVFWFAAVPGAAAAAPAGEAGSEGRAQLWPVAVGVFFGAFAWVCCFTWVVGHLRRLGGRRSLAAVDFAGGVTLLAFAGASIWRLFWPPL